MTAAPTSPTTTRVTAPGGSANPTGTVSTPTCGPRTSRPTPAGPSSPATSTATAEPTSPTTTRATAPGGSADSTGNSFNTTLWSSNFSPRTGWTFIPGDFNGDGRTDIANYYSGNGTWWISESTGNSFTTSLWSSNFSPNTGWTFIPGDFNNDGTTDIANYYSGNNTWWVSSSTGAGFVTRKWGSLKSLDHLSHFWTENVDGDNDDDLFAIDAYNGFVYRHRSSGTAFTIQSLVDTPWRTTISTKNLRQGPGSAAWLYFAQEFTWVRLTGLNSTTASTSTSAPLPRP